MSSTHRLESTTALGTWFYNVDTNLSGSNTNCADASGNTNFFCGANTGDWGLNPTAGNAIYSWTFTLAINGVIAGQEASLDQQRSPSCPLHGWQAGLSEVADVGDHLAGARADDSELAGSWPGSGRIPETARKPQVALSALDSSTFSIPRALEIIELPRSVMAAPTERSLIHQPR